MICYLTTAQAEEIKRRALMAQGVTAEDLDNIERVAEQETGTAELLAKAQKLNREYLARRTRAGLRSFDEAESEYIKANREKKAKMDAMLNGLILERSRA